MIYIKSIYSNTSNRFSLNCPTTYVQLSSQFSRNVISMVAGSLRPFKLSAQETSRCKDNFWLFQLQTEKVKSCFYTATFLIKKLKESRIFLATTNINHSINSKVLAILFVLFQGQCFVAINPGAFADGFEDRMSDLIDYCRSLVPVSEAIVSYRRFHFI